MELKGFLNGIFGRENERSLSRRDALAGFGLFGALLAAPNLIASRPAEAKPLDKPAEPRGSSTASDAKESEGETHVAEARDAELDAADVTDISARRRWWRRRWRRRHWGWRRRYWRRHWGWRRRHWGWRHRRWRRRYWY